MSARGLEIHQHSYVSGRGASQGRQLVHSHEGGDVTHQHPDTGPGSYMIDKDEWRAATGMRGGGRKKFSKKPTGDQLPIRELEDWQKTFDVIICKPSAPEGFKGSGAGIAPAIRMIQACRIQPRVRS